jgi:hypothetical protein
MRLLSGTWLLLCASLILACGGDDGGSNNPTGGVGGTSAGGASGGSAGSGPVLNCGPRCEARAVNCGLPHRRPALLPRDLFL